MPAGRRQRARSCFLQSLTKAWTGERGVVDRTASRAPERAQKCVSSASSSAADSLAASAPYFRLWQREQHEASQAKKLRDASGDAKELVKQTFRRAQRSARAITLTATRADDETVSESSSAAHQTTPAGAPNLRRPQVALPRPFTNEPAPKARGDGHLRGESFTRSETCGHGRRFRRGDGARRVRENKS